MKRNILILSLIAIILFLGGKTYSSYKQTYFSCNTIFSEECINKYYTSMNKNIQIKFDEGGIVIGGDQRILKSSIEYLVKKKIDENNNLSLFDKLSNKDFLNRLFDIN